MKIISKLIVVAAALVGLSACSVNSYVASVDQAVDQGRIGGMGKSNKFSYTYVAGFSLESGLRVGAMNAKPYSKIDQLNTKVTEGKYEGYDATFFLGKSPASDEWEVFAAMVRKDSDWKLLPVTLAK